MKLKKMICVLAAGMSVLCVLPALSGCEKLKNGIIAGDMDKGSQQETEPVYLNEERAFHQGEKVEIIQGTEKNPKNIGFVCKVTSSKIYSTAKEAGIPKEKLSSQAEYYGVAGHQKPDEPIRMISADEAYEHAFLVCELELENVNGEEEENITMLNLVSQASDQQILQVGYPSYFSASTAKQAGDSDYYHFKLKKGKSAVMQVGWYVDLDELDTSKLYLTEASDDPFYIKLNP